MSRVLATLLIATVAYGKDCAVGKHGGFDGSKDNPGDAHEMKNLAHAFNYGDWHRTQSWDLFLSGESGSMCDVEGVCCVKSDSGNRVVELYWERNNLKGSFPASFYKMSELVNIDFHLNKIQDFPSNLTAMPKLSTAQFGRNPICGQIPMDWVQVGFGKQLTKLNCNFCCLSGEFPDWFVGADGQGLPNLEEAYWCGNNFVGSIPPGVAKLSGLTKISLNLNSFTGQVPPGLATLPLVHDCRIGGDTDFGPYDTSTGSPEKEWLLKWKGNDFSPVTCNNDSALMHGICNNKGPKYDPGHYGPPSPVQCSGGPKPPTPPTPPNCDSLVSQCFDRCQKQYGGKISDKGSAAENCAKGCAGMHEGKVVDHDKICSLAPSHREKSCLDQCGSASSHPERIAECKYGCSFWSSPSLIGILSAQAGWVEPA